MDEPIVRERAQAPWYFDSLRELLHWDEATCLVPTDRRSRVPFPDQSSPQRQRVLLCHDVPLPYSAAECVGTRNAAESELAYRFREWSFIDDFVYFTHHCVSVPPTAWIEAAHRHGVRCLGSCVLEHATGRATLQQVLNLRSVFFLAYRLACLAERFNFDGWLLNFEVDLEVDSASRNATTPPAVQLVLALVSSLREQIQKRVGAHATVIWYDALTSQGRLAHQSMLNEQNAAFFRAASGLYLDYSWGSVEALQESVRKASIMNRSAADIYVGIDIYGRGRMPGGGGHRTFKAFDLAWSTGASVAFFAPAWTMQVAAQRLPDADTRNERSAQLFWLYQRHLEKHCENWDEIIWAWKRFRHLCPPRVLVTDSLLPVDTTFWPGWSRYGAFDLRQTQLQPSFLREWIASQNALCDTERVLMYWMESDSGTPTGWYRIEFPGVLGRGRLEAVVALRFLRVQLKLPLRIRYHIRVETARERQRWGLGLVTDYNRFVIMACSGGTAPSAPLRVPLVLSEEPASAPEFCTLYFQEPMTSTFEQRPHASLNDDNIEERIYCVEGVAADEQAREILLVVGDLTALAYSSPRRLDATGLTVALANQQSKVDLLRLTLDRISAGDCERASHDSDGAIRAATLPMHKGAA
ncbi:hypothetical protein CCYA_CCYA06G1928 [Cyanidiococcus yangmingshanensis]|nr:hypothetical protein CCYA_CCYA06G1928 [Cyanidiococcus yangmingshanensis]